MNAPTQSNGNNLLLQGRIVWTSGSSLFAGSQKKDYNTNAPIVGDDGQPVVEYGFGLAIPKVDPRNGQHTAEFTKIWQTLHQEAFTLYPSGQIPKDFAMKFKDGDSDVDDKGIPYSKREGYAGHIVLSCTTRIPIKFFIFQGGNNILVNDGIKNGDYVNVQLNIKAHPAKGRGKAGLYVNPSAVQLIQPGKEIINTPSGDQMFGMQAPVYNGVAEAYVAPQMPAQAAPSYPQQPAMPAQPYQAPPAAPQAQPHYGILPEQHQPAAPSYPQQPAMPAQPYQAPPAAQPAYNGQAPTMPPMPGMPR